VARRLVRVAVEDVGLADPHALPQAMAAQQAMQFLGQPEGDLALAQATVYLCQAPKSNAIYRAYAAALKDVQQTRNEPVPLHLRNAPTRLMKNLGYGAGYEYAHDLPEGRSEQAHLPPALQGRIYYEPTSRGFESQVAQRLAWRDEQADRSRQQRTSAPAPSIDPQTLAGEESQDPGD
jgi:putative ATPase